MATTFSSLADEVSRKLAGFTLRQDRQTHLSAAIDASTLSIPVGSAQNFSNGLIQIDDELIYIASYDRTSNIATAAPYGRGYNGTTAASHLINSRVVVSPTFPIVDVKNAINESILAVFPDVYAVNSYTFSYSPAKSTYELPDEVETVIAVSYQTTGPTKEWLPIRSWRVDPMANTASFGGSRNSISLYGGVEPGRTVQVFYSSQPQPLVNSADDFATVSGLNQSVKDVVVFGAAYRLSAFVDPGRLTFGSAEADQQSQIAGRAYGAGSNASKYLYSLYQQRLMEESKKLNDRYPIRVHYTR